MIRLANFVATGDTVCDMSMVTDDTIDTSRATFDPEFCMEVIGSTVLPFFVVCHYSEH